MDSYLQSALQKMGSNFLVAAFVPAMGFVVFSLTAFRPILPPVMRVYLGVDGSNLLEFAFVCLLLTTLLGFTLYTLSTYIYKSFEGYTSILAANTSIRRSLIQRQKYRAKFILAQKERVKKRIEKLEARIDRNDSNIVKNAWQAKTQKRRKVQLKVLLDRQYELVSSYHYNFPPPRLILPTRFGNILRAAEVYPGQYGIDAVLLWGRLAHTLPESGMEKLDQANNQCLFLLNCCLLAAISAISSLIAAGYQTVIAILASMGEQRLLYFIPIDRELDVYQQRVGIYLMVCILAILIARLLYQASLLNVSQYGSMIRSAYDLYRFGLLEALHLPLPGNLDDEKERWRQIGQFMAGGQEFGLINFRYQHPQQSKKSSEEAPKSQQGS